MLSTAVRRLVERFSPHAPHDVAHAETGAPVVVEPDPPLSEVAVPEPPCTWPPGRLKLAHRLWGDGFVFPGGEIETTRLARPLGASAATSLLIVGVGSGGPAVAVARNLGTWVSGFESDPVLLASALKLVTRAEMTKKVAIQTWDPANPGFAAKSHHHCLALTPFSGEQPEPIIDSLARALRPGGQLVLTEVAATAPLSPTDNTLKRWAALEKRDPGTIPLAINVTRMLGRVGLDVRIAEDISARHLEHAMLGWRIMLQALREAKPSRQQAAHVVEEAEMWLLRRRLMRNGDLRMMRWHAISRVPIA